MDKLAANQGLCQPCRLTEAGALILVVLLLLSEQLQAEGRAERYLDVLATEYPPYTSDYLPGSGSAFRALRYLLSQLDSDHTEPLVLVPHFVPPGRANLWVESGRWAVSFYPPMTPNPAFRYVAMEGQPIELGLFRRAEKSQAVPEAAGFPAVEQLGGKVAVGRQQLEKKIGSRLLSRSPQLVLQETDSLSQSFELLSYGRVDYVFAEKVAGFYTAQRLRSGGIEVEFSEPLQTQPFGVWVNTANPEGAYLYQRLQSKPQLSD